MPDEATTTKLHMLTEDSIRWEERSLTRREFQKFGALTEKAIFHFATHIIPETTGTRRKVSEDYHSELVGF